MRQTLLICLVTAGACFSQTSVPSYTVSTFAGGGVPLGDGGWAASALLSWPDVVRPWLPAPVA